MIYKPRKKILAQCKSKTNHPGMSTIVAPTGYCSNHFGTHAGITPFLATINPNLVQWFHAGAGLTLDGTDVDRIADQSGNGHDMVPLNANKPTYNATDALFNNEPTIDIDQTASQSFITETGKEMSAALSAPITAFCVFSMDVKGDNTAFFGSNPDSEWRLNETNAGNDINLTTQAGNMRVQSGAAVNTATVLAARVSPDALSSNIYNGTSGDTGKTIVIDPTPTDVKTHILPRNTQVVTVAEWGVYDAFLTDSQFNELGNYLADKYGVTWNDI